MSPLGQKNWVKRFCPGCLVWRSGGLRVQVVYRPLSFLFPGSFLLFIVRKWEAEKRPRRGLFLGGWRSLQVYFLSVPLGPSCPTRVFALSFCSRVRERKTRERADEVLTKTGFWIVLLRVPQNFQGKQSLFIYEMDEPSGKDEGFDLGSCQISKHHVFLSFSGQLKLLFFSLKSM